MEGEHIIETKNLVHRYEGSKAQSLSDVSIGIHKNVKTVILGGNGAGKSTLFFHFNGVFKPKSGKVLYEGKEIKYGRKDLNELRTDIAVVLQNPDDQIFSATVEEDIAFGPMNIGLPMEEVEARVNDALFHTGLTKMRSKPTSQLSYGQRKRVAFAGAMAMKPKVLVMDEPTAGLDPQMSQELMEMAEQLHRTGTTVIISTHDVDFAYKWAQEIHVLRRGKLIFSGKPEEFYADRREVYLSGLMQPSLFALNESHCGPSCAPFPRDTVEFASKIRPKDEKTGSLHLLLSDKNTDFSIFVNGYSADGKEMPLGVYGIDSRKAAFDAGARIDYVFNALETCLLECLSGKDAALIADNCMEPYVMERVEDLVTFGSEIPVIKHGRIGN